MKTRAEFARAIAQLELSHVDRATAFLWFYSQTQEYEERTAAELADDLHDEGFPRPRVDRLSKDLTKSALTTRGKRVQTYQLDLRRKSSLDATYLPLLGETQAQVQGAVLPPSMVTGTRMYLEKLVHQLNGAYEYGFYDACAVLCRRLMESLIIECYIKGQRQHEIQLGGSFAGLDKLIATIVADRSIPLGRNSPKTMNTVKQVGDAAAHDRTYITQLQDIDDFKISYRKLIQELLHLSGVQ